AYAKEKNIPISATHKKIYSIDKNIWGISIEGGMMEDLRNAPDEAAYILTKNMDETLNKPDVVEIEFAKGVPVKVNGKKADFLKIIEVLNQFGARHCIGRTDLVEDRTVGIKSREVYEAPAAWILLRAHQELESVVLDKDTLNFKQIVSLRYSQLAYQGLWFSRLRKSLQAFVEMTQEKVSGAVKLRLYKGNITAVSRESKHSLYKKELATYGKEDQFDRTDAEGFISIFSLPYRER
ncbi:MAG: argininosuccinate synthase, partial [Victivallales bacterium]|nr:argininosuccinate synthase [Victivallales bacterium]